jgi:hypothetical protein
MGPEVRAQALFRDRFVGVVRLAQPLCQGEITPARSATGKYISITRLGLEMWPIDEGLGLMGLERKIAAIVGWIFDGSGSVDEL